MMADYASDDDPTTEEEALRSPQRQERNDAMREEYNLSCEMEHESLKIDQKAKRQDQHRFSFQSEIDATLDATDCDFLSA